MPCRHVYEILGQETCPDCGRATHEINRQLAADLHKKHHEEGKHLKYKCEVCGGTIRVWWDI